MTDEIKPEILPPDGGLVQMWRWRVSPRTATFIKIGAAVPSLSWAAYLLQNFLQLRGVVNLTASRIDLALLTLCLLFAGYVITVGLPQKVKARIISFTVILLLAFAVEWFTPKPPIQSTQATTASSSTATNTASTDASTLVLPIEPLQSLTVSPIKLAFREQPVGKTSRPQIVTVINRGNAPRIITGIEITGNFSQTNDCAQELMVGDSCNVEVTFTPTTPGLTHGNLEISCIDPLFSSVNLTAPVDFSGSGNANIRSGVFPRQQNAPKPIPQTDKTLPQKSDLELKVSIVGPTDPAIVVDNQTDDVAEGVTWELVMFRTTDQAFFSYATQNIGYVKAHSQSARYTMQLNTLPHAPGGGQIANGDHFIGSIGVDCPLCRGTTVIVSFVWGSSGWFCEVPDGNGHLLLPKNMSKETITRFIETIDDAVKPDHRSPIL